MLFSRVDWKMRRQLVDLLGALIVLGVFVSCAPAAKKAISLASFTENYVEVSIYLKQDASGEYLLTTTFTPPEGYHLYSKDIPITGINGLGRPTLLELTSNSLMKATGVLSESPRAELPEFEPRELLVYPSGAVTLSLPVELPPGSEWIADEVKVMYMACSASLCKPPVVGKIVPVRVPGVDRLRNE
jgi:hypothetical protein